MSRCPSCGTTEQILRDLAQAEEWAAKIGQTVLTTTSTPSQSTYERATLLTLKKIRAALLDQQAMAARSPAAKARDQVATWLGRLAHRLRVTPPHFHLVTDDDSTAVMDAIGRYVRRNGPIQGIARGD